MPAKGEFSPEVIWLKYENGWLAETEHGFFFVYGMLNLWYIDYETGAGPYGDGIGMPLTQHGFQDEDAAKANAEKYEKSLNVIPSSNSLEEE
jgi:hypothetical protein